MSDNWSIIDILAIFLGASALVLLLFALVHRVRPIILSPIYAIIVFYGVIFSLGPFLYDPGFGGGGMSFAVSASDEFLILPYVISFICSLIMGVLLYTLLSKNSIYLRQGLTRLKGVRLTSNLAIGTLILFGLALLLEVVGMGLSDMLYRHTYLVYTSKALKGTGTALLTASMPGLGLLSGQRRLSSFLRGCANVSLAIAILTFAAMSTRTLAIAPAMFFLGRFLAGPQLQGASKRFALAAFSAPLLAVFPLIARSAPNQGLLAIPENLATLAGQGAYGGQYSFFDPQGFKPLLNNIFISVPITVTSMQTSQGDPWTYFTTALNPAPGFLTQWSELQVRLNEFTPVNTIGDLIRTGLWSGMLYFFVVGVICARLEVQLRRSEGGGGMLQMAQLGLFYMFMFKSLQYPLRDTTRILYYSIFLELVRYAFDFLRPRRSHVKKLTPRTHPLRAAGGMWYASRRVLRSGGRH